MKMRQSSIFNEYVKLAQENGLLSDEPIKKEAAEKDKEPTDVELLYGIKPNGKEDDESLAEKAHPETVVIGPAYDAMNAVVENLYQRQSIMTHIALKTPNGKPIQRRYVEASNDLTKSLVSVGFLLDNNDEEQLMRLADSCAERITKKAFVPFALLGGMKGLAVMTAAVGGLSYYFNHAAPLVRNIEENAKILMTELSEVSEKSYKSGLTSLITHIRDLNTKFIGKAQALGESNRLIQEAFISKDLNNVVTHQSDATPLVDEVKEILSQLETSATQLIAYKSSVEAEKDSDVSSEWASKIRVVWEAMFSTDDDDILTAIDSLYAAINKATSHAKATINSVTQKYSGKIQERLESMQSESPSMPGFDEPAATPAAPAANEVDEEIRELQRGYKNI